MQCGGVLTECVLGYISVLLVLRMPITAAQNDACGALRGQTPLCDCSKNRVVDCSNRNLRRVPEHIPDDTRTLHLNDNKIEVIRTGAFDNLYKLHTLYLNNNSIRNIQRNAFRNLFSVEELNLDNNVVGEISFNRLEHLISLKTLSMKNNILETIFHDSFYFKKDLRTIIVDSNYLACGCQERALKLWIKARKPPLFLGGALCQNFANTSLLSLPLSSFDRFNCTDFGKQTCFQCESQSSEECQQRASECSSSQNTCETRVEADVNGDVKMTKKCSSEEQCSQRLSRNVNKCRAGMPHSSCTFCCAGRRCNRNIDYQGPVLKSTKSPVVTSTATTTTQDPNIARDQSYTFGVTFTLMRDYTNGLDNKESREYQLLADELYRKLTLVTARDTDISSVRVLGFSRGSIVCNASVHTVRTPKSWYTMRKKLQRIISLSMETGMLELDLAPGSMKVDGEYVACFESREGFVKGKVEPNTGLTVEECKDLCRSDSLCAGVDYMRNTSHCYKVSKRDIEESWQYSRDCGCAHYRKNLKCVPVLPYSCESEVTENMKGRMVWPTTKPGYVTELPCPASNKPGSKATRKCLSAASPSYIVRPGSLCASKFVTSGGAVWLEPDMSLCKNLTMRSKQLEKLSDVTVTNENVEEISSSLAALTSEPSSLGPYDVTNAARILDHVTETPGVQINTESAQNLITCVSDLLNIDEIAMLTSEKTSGSVSSIVKNIENIGMMLKSKQSLVNIVAPNLAISAIQLAPSVHGDLQLSSTAAMDQTKMNQDDIVLSTGGNKVSDLSVAIELPKETLSLAADQMSEFPARVQFTVYQNDKFFKMMGDNKSMSLTFSENEKTLNSSYQLFSKVISARVGNVSLNNLKNPVVLKYKPLNKQASSPHCVFWDFELSGGAGGWSDRGCRVVSGPDDDIVQCQCDHLTNFALLMDVYSTGHSIDEANKLALSIISYVGCGISLLALTLALMTYLYHRKLRKDNPSKLLIHLCMALAMMIVSFLFSTFPFVRSNDIACKVVAALMHYFLLAMFMWMAVQAFYMYLALVKVFQTYYAKFILKCCLVGWGVPVIIVVITVAISRESYGNIGGELCWMTTYAFFGAAVTPVVLILMVNFVAFVLVIKQLREMSKRKLDKTKQVTTMSQLRGAFSVMILLGLTWTFAIFAIDDASLVFQYLFAIFNSLQGLFIFIFYCAMKPEVQRTWLRMLPCCPTPDTSTRSGTRGGTASTPVGSGAKKKFSLSLSWNQKKEGAPDTTLTTSLTEIQTHVRRDSLS